MALTELTGYLRQVPTVGPAETELLAVRSGGLAETVVTAGAEDPHLASTACQPRMVVTVAVGRDRGKAAMVGPAVVAVLPGAEAAALEAMVVRDTLPLEHG